MWNGVVAATGQDPDAEGIDFRWGGLVDEEEEEVEEEHIDYVNITHPRKEHEKKIMRTPMSPSSYNMHSSSPGICSYSAIPQPDPEWVANQRRVARRAEIAKKKRRLQLQQQQQQHSAYGGGDDDHERQQQQQEQSNRRRRESSASSIGDETGNDAGQQMKQVATTSAAGATAATHHPSSPQQEQEINDCIDSRIRAMSSAQVKSTSWSEVAGKDRELCSRMEIHLKERQQQHSAARNHLRNGDTNTAAATLQAGDGHYAAAVDEATLKRRGEAAAALHRSGHQHLLPDLPGFRAVEDKEQSTQKHLERIARRHHVEQQEALRLKIRDLVGACREKVTALEAELGTGAAGNLTGSGSNGPVNSDDASVDRQRNDLARRKQSLVELRRQSQEVVGKKI